MTDLERVETIFKKAWNANERAFYHTELKNAITEAFASIRAECLSMRVELPTRDEYHLMEKERLAILSEPKFENSKEWLNAYTQGLRWSHVWYQSKLVPSSGALNWPTEDSLKIAQLLSSKIENMIFEHVNSIEEGLFDTYGFWATSLACRIQDLIQEEIKQLNPNMKLRSRMEQAGE